MKNECYKLVHFNRKYIFTMCDERMLPIQIKSEMTPLLGTLVLSLHPTPPHTPPTPQSMKKKKEHLRIFCLYPSKSYKSIINLCKQNSPTI